MIDALLQGLRQTTALEDAAVVLGILYILLVMQRNRWGWVFGGVSSAIYVYLCARRALPMQALLQLYYVAMAVYGWWAWSRVQHEDEGRIQRWPLRAHVLALLGITVAGLLLARLLARETHAAWPVLDSMTTCTGLIATWMVARMKLENWLYWILADCVTVFLFAAQGYLASAALFVAYTIIAMFGFHAWLQKYRLQTP